MNPDDVTFENVPHVRPGGQYVGPVVPTVKATHLPTGNEIVIRSERSQMKARQLAVSMFEWMETEIRG